MKKFGRDGYSDDRYLSLFAGMAPARNPRVVLVVMINEPRGEKFYGGQVAGPVFSTVMAETLRLMNVEPDLALDPASAWPRPERHDDAAPQRSQEHPVGRLLPALSGIDWAAAGR